MEQGILSEIGAKKLGFPELAGEEVEYNPHPEHGDEFAKGVYYDGEYIGGIISLGQRGVMPIVDADIGQLKRSK